MSINHLESNLIFLKKLLIIINFHKNVLLVLPKTKNSNLDYMKTNPTTDNSNPDYNNTNEKKNRDQTQTQTQTQTQITTTHKKERKKKRNRDQKISSCSSTCSSFYSLFFPNRTQHPRTQTHHKNTKEKKKQTIISHPNSMTHKTNPSKTQQDPNRMIDLKKSVATSVVEVDLLGSAEEREADLTHHAPPI